MSSGADGGAGQGREEGSGDPGAPDRTEVGTAEADPLRDPLLRTLHEQLGDAVVGSEVAGDDVWIRVERGAWRRAAEVCRDQLEMDYFCFLSGIDWMVNPHLSGEKVWEPEDGGVVIEGAEDEPGEAVAAGAVETGVAGGETRFQLLARLYSTKRKVGITLKADLDDADLRADSWVEVYRGADWHEREAWEMYGFTFDGHPGLRHLYLPSEFEGHPLRKDFPLLAREVKPWPGLVDVEPIPGEADAEGGDSTGGEAQ